MNTIKPSQIPLRIDSTKKTKEKALFTHLLTLPLSSCNEKNEKNQHATTSHAWKTNSDLGVRGGVSPRVHPVLLSHPFPCFCCSVTQEQSNFSCAAIY